MTTSTTTTTTSSTTTTTEHTPPGNHCWISLENFHRKFVKNITDYFYCFSYCILAVDCIWSRWQYIGSCSTKCGKGYRQKTRIKVIEETNGGSCQGSSNGKDACRACTGEQNIYYFIFNILGLYGVIHYNNCIVLNRL